MFLQTPWRRSVRNRAAWPLGLPPRGPACDPGAEILGRGAGLDRSNGSNFRTPRFGSSVPSAVPRIEPGVHRQASTRRKVTVDNSWRRLGADSACLAGEPRQPWMLDSVASTRARRSGDFTRLNICQEVIYGFRPNESPTRVGACSPIGAALRWARICLDPAFIPPASVENTESGVPRKGHAGPDSCRNRGASAPSGAERRPAIDRRAKRRGARDR